MKSTFRTLFAVLTAVLMLLSACGTQDENPSQEPEEIKLALTIALGSAPDTLDPARCTAEGGETILLHLFENLMRWDASSTGSATLVPGQAESYTVETDYLGNATYTFTLRDDIFWSDGQAVNAHHFVSAWQRLANPAHAMPHSHLLSCIAGYDAVQESGDTSLLGVSAADNRTLVVKLNGNPPAFLYEVCAGAYTMPVRTYLPDNAPITSVTNGAYTLTSLSEALTLTTEAGTSQVSAVILTKSSSYYNADRVTVDQLRFIASAGSEADYARFLAGAVDFAEDLPVSGLETLAQNSAWLPDPVTSTRGVLFNTNAYPFDNADVRTAFRLTVDEQAIISALGDLTLRPATGLIPYGVEDYGKTIAANAASEATDKPPLVGYGTFWDFRTHSEEIVTLAISSDYDADCEQARDLLAAAGYPGGAGFPAVEYIYTDTPENRLIAELLQNVWKDKLGVTVTLRSITAEEYAQLINGSDPTGGETAAYTFQLAAMEFTVSDRYNAAAFLSQWHSSSENNISGYSSAAFDILLNAASAAAAAETYDAYLHDAEAILLESSVVIPLFYRGGSHILSNKLTGFYHAPNGVYFFSHIRNTGTN